MAVKIDLIIGFSVDVMRIIPKLNVIDGMWLINYARNYAMND